MRTALFTLALIPALATAQQLHSLPTAGGETWIYNGQILGTLQPEPASGGRVWLPHAPNSTQPPYGYGSQWGSGPQPMNQLQRQLSPYSAPSYWND